MQRWQMTILCLTVVVAYQPQESHLFFTGLPRPVSLPHSTDHLLLEFVREYGDQEEGLVFGNIVSIAVSETGTLAVLDRYGCQVWIVDTSTGDSKAIGGCGDGPGEFREFTAAAFQGDTLLVSDIGRASMVRLTLDGEEVDRLHVHPISLGAARFSDLHMGQDGSILVGLNLLPNSMVSEDRQLAVFDRFGGSVTRRGLVSPPVARRTPRNITRPISFCVGAAENAGEVIFAMNPWGPQVVLLQRSNFDPLLSVLIPVDWAQAEEHSLRPGHWGPMSPTPRVACGDRFAVAGYRQQVGGPTGETEVSSAAMVVFDLRENSMTVLGGDEPPEQGSVLFTTPGAATENRFFFYTNSFFGYPVIREYRIVKNGIEP